MGLPIVKGFIAPEERQMTTQDILTLYTYNAWANERVFDAVEPLASEQFLRDLGNSFPSVRDTVAHILGAEWIWLRRWLGDSPTALPSAANHPTVASLRDRFATIERERRPFLGGLTDARLAEPLHYRDIAGKPSALVLVQSLQHVVNHGTYHRGQVITLLRQLGAKPVSTDMSRFHMERGATA